MAFLKITLLILTIVAVLLGIKINSLIKEVDPPILENTWWGKEQSGIDNTAIVPFKITIPDEIILDLKSRLENARPLTPSLKGVAQDYGINSNLLQEIMDFWKKKYDWKKREKFLNKYPQFTTQIQGLKIHYIHVKPVNPKNLKVLPLLLLHGWPGSIREFYELIPLLTKPQDQHDFVFEVIIPSIPGFGFSEATSKPGLGLVQIAVVLKNLMQRLNFEKYYVQGGDFGSSIASHMAALFKNKVLGLHLNLCISELYLTQIKVVLGSLYPLLVVEKKYENKMYPLWNFYYNASLEFGYLHLQGKKCDTLGVSLNDSPIGLAAYILDKFITWSNPNWKTKPDGGLKTKFKYEDLLDNIMIYWVTNSITTSLRLYGETISLNQLSLEFNRAIVEVPTACAKMEHELVYQPDNFLKDKYPNLVQSNNYDDVGHFAAFEEPKILATDIWSAVQKIEKFRKIGG